MKNIKWIAAALLLPFLMLRAPAAEIRYVCAPDENFLRDMTQASLSELCTLSDVTGDYLNTPRGYAFQLDIQGKWSDGSAVTADQALEALTEAAPEWLDTTWTLPEGEPVSLEAAGFATLEEAMEAGHRRFYLDVEGFWGLEGGWLAITDRKSIRDTAMSSGSLEYYVNPQYLYRNYLAPGTAFDRWQGEFLGLCPEDTGETALKIEKIGENQLVLFTREAMAPSALMLKLSTIYPLAVDNFCGPYQMNTLENGEILLTRNPHYTGDRGADYPDAILCR